VRYEIEIRKANMNEADLVDRVIKAAYAPLMKILSRPPKALTERTSTRARQIQFGHILVAILGDELVGTVRIYADGPRGFISRLAVHPTHQRKGIGTALLTAAERALAEKGVKYFELEIYDKVDFQHAFFSVNGYIEVNKFERNGEIIVNMQKSAKKALEEEI